MISSKSTGDGQSISTQYQADQKKEAKLRRIMADAWSARDIIRSQVAMGRTLQPDGAGPEVTYGHLMEILGVDRFTLARVLGKIVQIDTELGSPLWCSFVIYKTGPCQGQVGGDFFEAARRSGHVIPSGAEPDFLNAQRGQCVASMKGWSH